MTTTLATMRQLEERQVEHEIKLLLWSPKMDIIAVGFVNGDVSLYRLNWQKLWTVNPPENAVCEGFSWRPDGKVIAIGYDNGDLVLLDIDSNVPIHKKPGDGGESGFSCLKWVLCSAEEKAVSKTCDEPPDPWEFMTRLPSLSKAYSYNPSGAEETENCMKISDGGITSLLLTGSKNGFVSVFMNGFLHCARIDLKTVAKLNGNAVVRDIAIIKSDLSSFAVFLTQDDKAKNPLHLIFSMPLISNCLEELRILSTKFSVLDGMVSYMADTLKQISEAWEGILVEMDDKLTSYSSKLPEDPDFNGGKCGMAADFLELLTFGIPSPDLEAFLVQDLTEKGLKKLGHSIEVSYSNVQRLVLKYLHNVSQSINCHLSELLGIVMSSEKFAVMLGVTTDNVIDSQQKAAAFWMKGVELQQVIDESVRSFKAFFRWLYVEILRLTDEDINEELSKMSQQDVRYIADFLDSFAPQEDGDDGDEESGNHHHRCLERVGQYLQDKDLQVTVDRSKNPWHKFLDENEEDFRKIPFIVRVNESKSLIQEFAKLRDSVSGIFNLMQTDMTDKCGMIGEIYFPEFKAMRCGQFEVCEASKIYGFFSADLRIKDRLLFFEISKGESIKMKGVYLTFENVGRIRHASSASQGPHEQMNLVDCQFYTMDTVSLLVQPEETNSVNQRMIQLNISDVEPHFRPIPLSPFNPLDVERDIHGLKTVSVFEASGQACHRELERISSIQFAVSGPRKVAAFLFQNQRRVRIYDMEIDEDDYEDYDEELANSGLSSSELNISA